MLCFFCILDTKAFLPTYFDCCCPIHQAHQLLKVLHLNHHHHRPPHHPKKYYVKTNKLIKTTAFTIENSCFRAVHAIGVIVISPLDCLGSLI